MKTWLKRGSLALLALLAVAFLGFLYFIPPLFLIAPETFQADVAKAAPVLDHIADPAQRLLADRGRTLVMNLGCIGCHATNGDTGPDYSKYLAGGAVKIESHAGRFVSRNLTPDPETGLARRTDGEVKRVLRSGTLPDGHVVPYTSMPWGSFSHLTDEDRHAIVVYLRNIPAVKHQIPDAVLEPATLPSGAVEGVFGLKDYGIN